MACVAKEEYVPNEHIAVERRSDGPARSRTLTITDSAGGSLTLHLTRQERHALVEACRHVVHGSIPPGASMIKLCVSAGEVYMVSARLAPDGQRTLRLANLYDPAESVSLPCAPDAREDTIMALVEQILGPHLITAQ